MTFYAFGLNHENAAVAMRERFALGEEPIRHIYRQVARTPDAEVIIVSTCNRTEAYLFGHGADLHSIQSHLAEQAGVRWPEAEAFLLQDEAAIRHILQVTAGLKSLVLGDAQIFAQVKAAYQLAVDEDAVGSVMHRLMHTAFRAAKQVATDTELGNGAASVSSAAAGVARRHIEDRLDEVLHGYRAVMIGAGQMGRLALEALQLHDLSDLTIINRTRSRAASMAADVGALVADWEDRYAALASADVVIVATGAEEPVLRAEVVPTRTRASDCLVIDIAVPRNVDPAIDALPGYRVIDMDRLQDWIDQVAAKRRAALPQAQAICDELVNEFVTWVFHQQALQPAIHAIRETFEAIRLQEIERHDHRFVEADQEELDRLTRSIMQKLLAVPIVRLKSTDPGSIDFVRGVKLLSMLFSRPGCDDASASEVSGYEQARILGMLPAEEHSPAQCPFESHLTQPSTSDEGQAPRDTATRDTAAE